MKSRTLRSALGVALSVSVAIASPGSGRTGSLSTADTHIRLLAGNDRITMGSLAGNAKRSWATLGETSLSLVPFAISNSGKVPLHWHFVGKGRSPGTLTFTFACRSPHLIARSNWQASKRSGPIEHTLTIVNLGQEAVTLPRQDSLAWSFSRTPNHALETWWVEKGAGEPSPIGVHRTEVGNPLNQLLQSGPYMTDELAYSKDGGVREPIPWVTVYDQNAKAGWYAGIEFSGRTSLQLKSEGERTIGVRCGIAPEPKGRPEFHTIVQPGEAYALPTVFVGCYRGEVEDGCSQLRHWVDAALRPKAADSRYPLLTLNSWGGGMDINASVSSRMMHDAATLGIEMFHVDAGWFRGVGDWRPNPTKFPNGIAPVANEAHSLGLKFGLWVGWTQGGIDPDTDFRQTILNVHAPDRAQWFVRDYDANWKPADFVGADLCLADPEASKWCLNLLEHIVKDYHLDMLEHDQRMIAIECNKIDHGHTDSQDDISYRAALGYYGVYDALRKQNPDLLFENCVNGGRIVDFGAARRAHYFSITDSYYPLANRRAFYDTSFVMPPSMCECYEKVMPVKNIGEFKSMLRSGMMGWCTIMQDPGQWTSEQTSAAKREFETYKTRLRPLIKYGDLYHISARPDGRIWDGEQYLSRSKDHGVLYAFRGTVNQPAHAYVLKGLNPRASYRLHFQDYGQADTTISGEQLMEAGVNVHLPLPETSQLVFLTRVPR